MDFVRKMRGYWRMSSFYKRSSEVVLNYQDEGQGSPILMIHGVGADLESWDGVLSHLQFKGRFIRYDLRGHGQSYRTPGPFSLGDFVDDAIALLNKLGIDKITVIGFSLGGLIAQALAISHPERVEVLCLISTVANRTKDEQIRVNARADTLENEGAHAHLANAVDRWFTDEFVEKYPEVLEARRQKSLNNHPDSYVNAYRVLASNDLANQLRSISVPTLVATGENDIGSSTRMAKYIHEQINGSQLYIFPLLKHSVLLEAPEQVAALVNPFLESNLNSSKAK